MSQYYRFQTQKSLNLEQASEEQAAILDDAKRQVGFIPNMYKGMVNLPALLKTYLYGYDQFRENGEFSSAEQEVVFLAISQSNGCDYCTAAHSTLAANKSGVPADVLEAIRSGEPITDDRLAAIYAMATELNSSRGRAEPEAVERFLNVGFTEKHILSIVLAISVKVLSNYSNHLFDPEVDAVFEKYAV